VLASEESVFYAFGGRIPPGGTGADGPSARSSAAKPSLKEMMIRKETSADIQDIRSLNDLAFAGPVEATIINAIRDRCQDALSLVAVEGAQIN